ncbi:hypothetical protein Vadar_012725 [Vaccinium darrowii]|uniref:Uncharacterized protein n=1 Tax=Vaccinium darrowii TaxID=229202 RepID=A0ACB7Z4Z0_9ERIC|nr:hypothetical protein Vadar_012725 [Vaccinium darrowii]
MLKQTPFWLLIHVIRNGTMNPEKCPVRTHEVVTKLITAYNPSKDNFRLGRNDVNLSANDVKLIFSLTGGTRPFEVKLKKKEEVLFAKRNNITTGRLISKAIGEMLQSYVQEDETVKIEDTMRLVCMCLIVKLFFPTSGISISWKHVHVLEEINQIKKYDWASEIHNELMNSIKKNQHSPKEYWLCEHINMNEDDQPDHAIPRLLKWNIPSLESFIKKTVDLKKATDVNVKTDELRETDQEAEIYKMDLADVGQKKGKVEKAKKTKTKRKKKRGKRKRRRKRERNSKRKRNRKKKNKNNKAKSENYQKPLNTYSLMRNQNTAYNQQQDGGSENPEVVCAVAVDTSTKPVIEKMLKDRDVMFARTKELLSEWRDGKQKARNVERIFA